MLLTITIVIGIGIFFKNKSIFAASHGQSWIVLTGWAIGIVVAMFSAISFALISKKLKKNDNSIAEFARFAFNEKVGNGVKKWITYIYFPIFSFTIALFTSMQFLELVQVSSNNSEYWIYLYLTTFLLVFLYIGLININFKIIKKFNIISSFIKMLPFIIFVIVALSALWSKNTNAYWLGNPLKKPQELNQSIYNDTSSFSGITIVFWIIPSILFTLDGYIVVIGNKRASSSKSLAWGITMGMIIVAIFYICAAVAMLKEGVASVPGAIVQFLGGDINKLTIGYNIIYKSVNFIIVISGLGSFGGFVILWKRLLYQTADDHTKERKNYTFKHMCIGWVYSCLPWLILLIILKIIQGKSSVGTEVFDEVSNIVLLTSFFINSLILIRLVILAYFKKIKASFVFMILATIASLAIFAVVAWTISDRLVIDILKNSNSEGLFNLPKWNYVWFFSLVVIQSLGTVFLFKHKE